MAANDTDNDYTSLLSLTRGAANSGAACYAYYNATGSDYWGPTVVLNMGTILNSSTGKFDWNVLSFEDDNVSCERIVEQ